MNRVLHFSVAAIVCLAVTIPVVSAESLESVRFHAAQAFRIGSQLFAAGDYSLRTLHTGSNTPLLYLEPNSGPGTTVLADRVPMAQAAAPAHTHIQLEQSGTDVRLSSVWFTGLAYFYQLHSAAQ